MNGAKAEFRSYVIGLLLSLLLTALAFGVVLAGLERTPALLIVTAAAIAQIVVQLRFFLHIRWRGQKREDLQLVLFSTLLLGIMVGGTLWIMTDLSQRM